MADAQRKRERAGAYGTMFGPVSRSVHCAHRSVMETWIVPYLSKQIAAPEGVATPSWQAATKLVCSKQVERKVSIRHLKSMPRNFLP